MENAWPLSPPASPIFLSALAACAQDAIIGISNNHLILFWNASAERMFGYPAQEVMGLSISSLLTPTQPGEWKVYSDQVSQGFGVSHLATAWRAKSGAFIPITVALSPIHIPAGGLLGMSIIARELGAENFSSTLGATSDIGGKGQMAQLELRRLYEQTRLDAETKTQLLREINHRVKNNLISILGLIQAEQLFTPQKQNRPIIKEALDHLDQLVRGLIEVHHLLSETHWQPMRLSELALRIISGVANSLGPSKQINVQVNPSPVLVSPRQANSLALALNELATNTLKYAAAGRMMTRVAVRIDTEDEFILLEYRDDGPGFPDFILRQQGKSVGLALLQHLATGAFRGSLTLSNDHGAMAVLRIKAEETNRT